MNIRLLIFSLSTAALLSNSHSQNGVLDLTNLHNYANQEIPNYIGKDNTPGVNPISDLGATLGRVLFYDKRLSFNNTVSCSSCHQQENGFSDLPDASTGVAGTTGRHSMRLINARFSNEIRFFWDERATSLEDQTTQPIQDHIEMGFSGTSGDPDFSDLITTLAAIEEYQVLFTGVFGDSTITEPRIQQALAQFVRSIQSFDSKYDEGRLQVTNGNDPFPNFSASENAGKQLFMSPPGGGPGGPGGPRGAGCNACHNAPEFDIAPNSRSNGVITAIGGGTDTTNTRAPSLRDLAKTDGTLNGGMMHDGSFTSFRQVINHYNTIPGNTPNLDNRLRPGGNPQRLNLNEQQKNDLEAFLKTLSGTSVYIDPRWSNPFDPNDQLSLIVLPTSQISITMLSGNDVRIQSPGVRNVTYHLEHSNDLQTWNHVATYQANATGELSATLTQPERAFFFRFVYEPAMP